MELLVVIALALGLFTISLLKRRDAAAGDPGHAEWWDRTVSDPVAGPVARSERGEFLDLCGELMARFRLDIVTAEQTADGCLHWRVCSHHPLTGGEFLVVVRHSSRDSDPVSREDVLALSDAVRAQGALKGIFLTNGRFAPGAGDRAEGPPIALFDGPALASLRGKLVPE